MVSRESHDPGITLQDLSSIPQMHQDPDKWSLQPAGICVLLGFTLSLFCIVLYTLPRPVSVLPTKRLGRCAWKTSLGNWKTFQGSSILDWALWYLRIDRRPLLPIAHKPLSVFHPVDQEESFFLQWPRGICNILLLLNWLFCVQHLALPLCHRSQVLPLPWLILDHFQFYWLSVENQSVHIC